MESFFQSLVGITTPIFVIAQMANVGLTQKPQKILHHLKQRTSCCGCCSRTSWWCRR